MRVLLSLMVFSFIGFGYAAEKEFPIPTEEEVTEASNKLYELGKGEVFSLSWTDFTYFVANRYYYGNVEPFNYYNCNPDKILDPTLPATILVHASESNQGAWLPLLESMKEEKSFTVFSFNFQDETALEELIQKIENVRDLYLDAGAEEVKINLIGHSLGGIAAAGYAFDEELAVEKTQVDKVITIATRLKNPARPAELPLYAYCYPLLGRIEQLSEKMECYQGAARLYTIAAENDWLLPKECTLQGEKQAVIPNCGHALAAHSKETHKKVIEWLNEE